MRFIVRVGLGMVLAASLGLLGLYAGMAAARLGARLAAVLPPELLGQAMGIVLTPARYAALRLGLAGAAGAAALGLLATYKRRVHPRYYRSEVSSRVVRSSLGDWWPRYSRAERALLLGLLLVAVGVRLWLARAYPLSFDEVASYDYWVLPGPAVTASYYAYPNNHILPNLLAGVVHAGLPAAGSTVALRLVPTLVGLALLPLGYALLRRYLSAGAALLGWGLFSLAPLPVVYAVAGRGYGLALAALLAGLGASLALLRPAGQPRRVRQRAWLLFCLSAVVGLYAVPTHAYGLGGLGLSLAVGFGFRPRRWRQLALGQLALATLGIAGTVGVLYAPVLAASGWRALVANPYLLQLSAADFWRLVGPYYLPGLASELLGQGKLSALGLGALVLAVPGVLQRGGLPEPTRRLGWLLYAQLTLWLLLLPVQRVFPPARTLLVVLLSALVLGALVGQVAWTRVLAGRLAPRLAAGLRVGGLALGLASYGGYRLYRDWQVWAPQARQRQQVRRAYEWLQAQHPALVRIGPGNAGVYLLWQHYALEAGRAPLPLRTEDSPPASAPRVATRSRGPVYEVVPAAPPGRAPVYAAPGLVILAEN